MTEKWFDWDLFWGWFVAWTIVMVFSFTIASMTTDAGGRQEQGHVESLPANVAMLNARSYLIAPGARVSPSLICRGEGSGQGDTSIKTISDVGKSSWPTYIECERGQSWNDKRKRSPNFAHAMQRVVTTPLSWIIAVTSFIVFMFYPFVAAMEVSNHNRRLRKIQKKKDDEEKKEKVIDAEDKRKELTKAYAAGDIDDIEFEQGLNRVYDVIGRPKE